MLFEQGTPNSSFRQDGPIGEVEGATLEGGNDGVSHVGDQDGHGRHGDKRPDNEEGFSSVAGGAEVAIADGEQRDVAEVECLEVGNALGFGFCFPEPNSTYAPEQPNCEVVSFGVKGNGNWLDGKSLPNSLPPRFS